MMTQNDKVLRHLQEKGPLTPLQALDLYRVFRLAARVADLRRRGYTVTTIMKNATCKRSGRVKRYAVYHLEE